MTKKHKVLIYTDASFKNNYGGWSAIIIYNNKKELISGKVASYIRDSGTSEFYAVLKAFEHVLYHYPKEINKISFNTDHFGIVDSFRGVKINSCDEKSDSISKIIKKMIIFKSKRRNIFLNANHVKSHQPLLVFKSMSVFENLRKSTKTIKMIEKFKIRKETLLKNADYDKLRKGGNNKSSILNNIVDAHSKRMRRKAERSEYNKTVIEK